MAQILVVSEDYPFINSLVETEIGYYHDIFPKSSVEKALRHLEEKKPDLVIADYRTDQEDFLKIVDAALRQGAALLVVSDRPGRWHVYMKGAGNILMVLDIPLVIRAVNAALKQREEERQEQNGTKDIGGARQ